MAIHTVVPRPDHTGYDIEVVDANGGRHTMLGFMTKAEADEWIVGDRKVSEIRGCMKFEPDALAGSGIPEGVQS